MVAIETQLHVRKIPTMASYHMCGDHIQYIYTLAKTYMGLSYTYKIALQIHLYQDSDSGLRQFADDFQKLACRSSDVSGLSCYAIDLVDPTIQELGTAFVSFYVVVCLYLLITFVLICSQ